MSTQPRHAVAAVVPMGHPQHQGHRFRSITQQLDSQVRGLYMGADTKPNREGAGALTGAAAPGWLQDGGGGPDQGGAPHSPGRQCHGHAGSHAS
jgi:hypothetical protein